MKRLAWLIGIVCALSCTQALASWTVVEARWRPDASPYVHKQVWQSTIWSEGWSYEEQFYPKLFIPSGSAHVVLRNESEQADTLELVSIDGKPIADLVTTTRKAGPVIWRRLDAPKLGPPDPAATVDGDWSKQAISVDPGRWAECVVRFREVPKSPVRIGFKSAAQGSVEVTVPLDVPKSRIESISFSPKIDRLYVYLRSMDGTQVPRGKVRLDGKDAESVWSPGPRPGDLMLVEARLDPAWEYGSHHLIVVELPEARLVQPVRAWDGYFTIGLYGTLEPEKVKAAREHGINTYFTGHSPLLDEMGMNYVPGHGVGEGRMRTPSQSGVLFYQNKDEPDAHDWTWGEELPVPDRLGVMAEPEVLPNQRYQRARDPRTPNLLLIDNTFKPLNWYMYGQISDIFCTDPYVPLNGRQIDYVWQALDTARDACAPRPVVSVLWACGLDGARKLGHRPPTPEEERMMVFHALGSGVKGISYFIDMTSKTGEGQFSGLSDLKPLWEEVGRTNKDVAALSPYLSIGCPVPIVPQSQGVWTRALMCGPDKVVAIVVNTGHYIGFETQNEHPWHEPPRDVRVVIPLPARFKNCEVQEVVDGSLREMDMHMGEAMITLSLDEVDTARAFVITMKPAVKENKPMSNVPSYLKGYEDLYAKDPRAAALEWFRDAKYGLFLHYGLYSLPERHEWDQFLLRIPVAEYAKLIDDFKAEKFDAGYITDLALAAGMKYINITTRHHESFCLFDTKQTPFNSLNSPAKRDLIAELADSCRDKGLGLFFYYSHGRDWKHPHAPNNDDWGGSPRPKYDPPEPSYAYGKDHDLRKYVDFMKAQIRELLTQYGPVAGIWLDGRGVPVSGDASKFKLDELYAMIRELQPQCLISYKEGVTSTEDFRAPEYKAVEQSDKPIEICTTLFPDKVWGYSKEQVNQSKTADVVWEIITNARERGANLLLNTGPRADGSIDPIHDKLLRDIGARLHKEGFPGE